MLLLVGEERGDRDACCRLPGQGCLARDPARVEPTKVNRVKDVSWQYRVTLSAVAAASLNLSGILIGSGMPMVGCACAAFGAFTLGVLTALTA